MNNSSSLHTAKISTLSHFVIENRAKAGEPASPKHWTAPVQLIREQGYDLSAARYQPRLPVRIDHRPLADIILDVEKVEQEITEQVAVLRQMLEPNL
jgi:hypothetical protein